MERSSQRCVLNVTKKRMNRKMVTYFIPRPKTRPAPPAMIPRKADRAVGVHRTNCPNCCAVITGPICEYCGTRFEERQVCLPITVSAEEAAEVFQRWNETVFGINPCRDVQAIKLPTKKQR